MNTTIWLRISAIVSLLFTVGHSLGGMQNWSPMADNPVLLAMRTVHFDIMGMSRSYLDLYLGFGYSITVGLLLQSVLLWILASAARTHAAQVRPMIAAFALAAAATGVIAWKYIFLIPASLCLALFATLVMAFISTHRGQEAFIPGTQR
jgi:hypothetical protein